jgi:hypothetical protein
MVLIKFEGNIIHNHDPKEKGEKGGKPRFYGQNKLLSKHLILQPLGSSGHMVAYRSYSENT